MLLRLDEVCAFYGSFEVLRNISLNVDVGEVVTLLGANGAGKTTLLHVISGLLHPATGTIELDGKAIHKMSPDAIVRLGISHCPEGRMLFAEMPVHKNLYLGAYVQRSNRTLVDGLLQEVYGYFPVLKDRSNQMAGTLSGGEQQMLAIGRALMSNPKLLMLDEPSLGLAPLVVELVMDSILKIRERGTAVLLIEQNAAESLRVADRGYVVGGGSIVVSGTSESLKANEKVRQAYLGQ